MKRMLTSMAFILTISGCGGGGGGNSWDGPLDAAGFPEVAGTYSVMIEASTVTCSDGSSGTLPASSHDDIVTESGNEISVGRESPIVPPNANVIAISPLSGLVENDGTFSLTETAQVEISGIPGQVTINYSVTGQFTTVGWSGNIDISYVVPSANTTCQGSTTFSGNKLS